MKRRFFWSFILGYENISISSSTFSSILKLADLSKIFENALYDQIFSYFKRCFSEYRTGYRKGVTQKGARYAALPTDLAIPFDYLPNHLVIAKPYE